MSEPPVPPAAPRHVMVVDDDPNVRNVIEETLRGAGFRVTGLPDARRIAEVLREGDVAEIGRAHV